MQINEHYQQNSFHNTMDPRWKQQISKPKLVSMAGNTKLVH